MAATDHLSGAQFFHASPHEFKPGDELTREGAWRAKNPRLAADLDAGKMEMDGDTWYSHRNNQLLGMFPTNNQNHPVEDHLYYGDQGFVTSGESAGYGGHVYQVEHVTNTGRPAKKHTPDPNYTSEGMSGAYRTKNRLRVVGEVDQNGNPL